MPPRVQVVDQISRWLNGGVSYSFSEIDPAKNNGMTTDKWDECLAEADDLFVSIVHAPDWVRVLLSAMGRHEFMLVNDPEHRGIFDTLIETEAICPECVVEALLMTERSETWAQSPFNETEEEARQRGERMTARSEAAWEARSKA